MQEDKSKINKHFLITTILVALIIPGTILFGVYFLDDRKYYFISLILIIYSMIPFMLAFENKKVGTRELVIIAVLIAIAVAGRAAFFMVPQFKPVVAIIIIAGVCLGAETGFIVGAITGFVSNFYFGQGPWTPWQMFCFGIIGFLAGIIFNKGLVKTSKIRICIFGGLSTFFIYGGIMNLSSLLMAVQKISWPSLITTYVAGFWFDIIHGLSSVIFLYFLYNPMKEKLERIKTKYGLF